MILRTNIIGFDYWKGILFCLYVEMDKIRNQLRKLWLLEKPSSALHHGRNLKG